MPNLLELDEGGGIYSTLLDLYPCKAIYGLSRAIRSPGPVSHHVAVSGECAMLPFADRGLEVCRYFCTSVGCGFGMDAQCTWQRPDAPDTHGDWSESSRLRHVHGRTFRPLHPALNTGRGWGTLIIQGRVDLDYEILSERSVK